MRYPDAFLSTEHCDETSTPIDYKTVTKTAFSSTSEGLKKSDDGSSEKTIQSRRSVTLSAPTTVKRPATLLNEKKTPTFKASSGSESLITPLGLDSHSKSFGLNSVGPTEHDGDAVTHGTVKSHNGGSTVSSRWRRIGRIGLGPPKRAEYSLADVKASDSQESGAEDDMHEGKQNHHVPAAGSDRANAEAEIEDEHLRSRKLRALSFSKAGLDFSKFAEVAPQTNASKKPLNHNSLLNAQQGQMANPFLDTPVVVPQTLFPGAEAVTISGHTFIKLGVIGKGGSSKVFRIIAPENKVIYALKEVDFENADYAAVQGYKNEIALLKKLSGHERIIRLYAAEVNDIKGQLSMVMEYGECDMAHLLAKNSHRPINLHFIRLYWQQMLQAVQVVHEQNIVHSDLKPANFLLVSGSLKLIDFGIAKAIENNTTNIHRDTHVGTVNYMAPEALIDTNADATTNIKLVKLGRPSDVWSLGCILYQMVYGHAPFAHLNMIKAIAAIPDVRARINFPETAVPARPAPGSNQVNPKLAVPVPPDLIRVMKSCLERDQRKRLTIPELLRDPFLHPGEAPTTTAVAERPTRPDATEISASQLSMIIERSVELSRQRLLSKDVIFALAKDCISNLQKHPRQ
ncbi:TTK protein kinase Mph1 [Schizosaccharomyces japonicus yFS275]|uniref:TTK protein kinase Mph1 n=1 Tax=Schizosaccharomyces japonicus (strain yFS275 / FY16936) TaxID=402676 RepID=B6K601_SCHJY|nr:TTK protein kinase Mph1 [Schizosaccharomyces japonicus yFS275]EEB08955.2 TTK protein kinase Mph1 [Schizosaccharomyces japonicus yFS275]